MIDQFSLALGECYDLRIKFGYRFETTGPNVYLLGSLRTTGFDEGHNLGDSLAVSLGICSCNSAAQ